jgi:divalent metal cation (Fe/Co/Zn/Cd) transporter
VLIGIAVAVLGGPDYRSADDWAALVACAMIAGNGVALLRSPLDEIMDASAPPDFEAAVRHIASGVEGVVAIEKCRIRKSGFGYIVEMHVVVHGDLTVRAGHQIGHDVKDRLTGSDLKILDVVSHIEPA